MVELCFDYCMELVYSIPVKKCHYTVKCIPKNTKRQRLIKMNFDVLPNNNYCFGTDGFGNRKVYGSILDEHSSFVYHVYGVVGIDQILFEEDECDGDISIFRCAYGKTLPGEELMEYYNILKVELIRSGITKPYDIALHLMRRLYKDYSYKLGTTTIEHSAEEAWKLGCGVCQDYAHIYVSLCRMFGIPARYVTGLMIGEGASHAWVECLCMDKWIGFDPTNNLLIDDSYIKLSDGRDATDCLINRGTMQGGGSQTQNISVKVTRKG